MNQHNKKNAFTLIELLVVIAIIGVLATLAVVALQQARQNARDSKRMADMKQVHTALELYYYENSRYPTTEEFQIGSPLVSSSTGEVFIYSIPSAPTPADGDCQEASNTYTYLTNAEGSTYTIDFCTGKQVSDLPQGAKQMTPGGIIFGASGETGGGGSGGVVSCSDYTSGNGECEYGGQTYQIVQIGTQTWFAENLNYDNGCLAVTWVDNSDEGWCGCYDNDPDNCNIYGKLYQWRAAMNWDGVGDTTVLEGTQGICPEGWHVPTQPELFVLKQYVIDNTIAENTTVSRWLKSCRQVNNSNTSACLNPLGGDGTNTLDHPRWNEDAANYGIDAYSFNALPTGFRWASGSFAYLGEQTHFWASSVPFSTSAWALLLTYSNSSVNMSSHAFPLASPLRCLKN